MKPRPLRRTAPIDWQAIRERLARALAATEAALLLAPDRAGVVLDERARALARPLAAPDRGDRLELVTFSLGREHYAVATPHVREIVRFTDFTPVPGTPDFLVGVINLRGEVLAVFDLRRFFGVEVKGVTDLARVLVLGGERAEFGILADSVDEVVVLSAEEVLEPPSSLTGIGREYLRGVTANALVVLDGAVLLRDGRLYIDQVEEAGG